MKDDETPETSVKSAWRILIDGIIKGLAGFLLFICLALTAFVILSVLARTQGAM